MARFSRAERVVSDPASEASTSTSPDRGGYEDTDFFLQANDSQSSIGVSTFRDLDMSFDHERGKIESPVNLLPPELLIAVFSKLGSTSDLKNCMLVSKCWARNSVDLLWHRPLCNSWKNLLSVVHSIRKTDSYFAYHDLIKRLNLSSFGQEVSDGTVVPLSGCKRVERLTLTNCSKLTDSGVEAVIKGNQSLLALDISGVKEITDKTLLLVAENCKRLQGLNITGCKKITDRSLVPVAENCRSIKRLKLNDCNLVSDPAVFAFAVNCRQMLEIDLHNCKLVTDEALIVLLEHGNLLRELRLAQCNKITDESFLTLPDRKRFDSLRILDLTACEELTDRAVERIIHAAPRLRNLVLAKCKKITDRAVLAICKLGKNLHYVHLGHCAQITDGAVMELVRTCNRIRYIDLACCHRLTDTSIMQLASLPKLRRIGLVKCQAITDNSILALAQPRVAALPGRGMSGPSSLERVHLSYCIHLTLQSIYALLTHCPRLTHLSLTGVHAFLRDELTEFCREAPPEFTDHQRDVFCVFSGPGVSALREHFNHRAMGEERSRRALYNPNDASDPNDPNAPLDPSGIILESNAQLTNSEGESEGMEYPAHGHQVEVFYHHPSQDVPPYIISGEEDVTEVDVTEEDDDGIVEAGYVTNLMGEAALTAHAAETVNGAVHGGHVIDMAELNGETLDGDTPDDDTIEEESDTGNESMH